MVVVVLSFDCIFKKRLPFTLNCRQTKHFEKKLRKEKYETDRKKNDFRLGRDNKVEKIKVDTIVGY
jgi:hypothetical protein